MKTWRPLLFLLPKAISAGTIATSKFDQDLRLSSTQAQRISLLSDADFIFDFRNPVKGFLGNGTAMGHDGSVVTAGAATFPAIIAEDVSMAVGTIGPCGINTPHTHPRATEFNYVVNGSFTTGMLQENGARVVLGNVTAGQASLFPAGSIHFEANMNCAPAVFVAAFSNPDGGVLQVAQGLFGMPAQVLSATFGSNHLLTQDELAILHSMIPANVAFGLDECLSRCGLKSVVGDRNVIQSLLPKLLRHTHITGYAYGAFVVGLALFWTLVQQSRKTHMGNNIRLSSTYRRTLMHAPTLTLIKERKAHRHRKTGKTVLAKSAVQIEFPANLTSLMCMLFWGVNVGLACWDLPDEKPPRELFQRIGWLAIWNMCGLVILAMKASPLPLLLGRSHDSLVIYHKMMAITAFFEVWIHSIWGFYIIPKNNPTHIFHWGLAQTGAIIATTCFTLVVLTAWSAWFVKRHFEAFLRIHVIGFIGLLVGLVLHNHLLLWYVVGTVGLYAADKFTRFLNIMWINRNKEAQRAVLTPVQNATKVSFFRNSGWRAGSHIYITLPGCDPFQSHPYTIASIAKDPTDKGYEVQLLVQASGGGHGFSDRLLALAKESPGPRALLFHGPYGAAPDMTRFDRAVCIGAGSGITLPIAMTQAFLFAEGHPDTMERHKGKVDLIWSTANFESFGTFDLINMRKSGANIHLYETQAKKPTFILPLVQRTATFFREELERYTEGQVAQELLPVGNNGTHLGKVTMMRPVTNADDFHELHSDDEDDITTSGDITSEYNQKRDSTQVEEMLQDTDLSYLHLFDRVDTQYLGTQHNALLHDPDAPVSAAASMPSFIASASNRTIHRRAVRAQGIETELRTSPGGSIDQTTTDVPSLEDLRRIFEPVGKTRPDYEAFFNQYFPQCHDKERIVIVVCGKKAMCRSVRNAIAQAKFKQRVYLHIEEF